MKISIPAILTFLLAAVLTAAPLSKARADDVNFDLFYNSLSDDGDWYNTPQYGYVWQPYVAYKTDKWRPYTDGYWAQTDDGWTWVSYENFGWAAYHYGRWTKLEGTGWVWVPGYDWGPGWVSWRNNNDYVGWAPLPPKPVEEAAGGEISGGPRASIDYNDVEVENGYTGACDDQYNIGPDNYCFVQVRQFGAPMLSAVLVPPAQNIVIIQNTINVTNISYRRGPGGIVVFAGGPDFAFISGHVDRPIQRLRIDRHEDIGFLHDHTRGGVNPTLVKDGVLSVAAPRIAHVAVNFAQVKPARIKSEITQIKVNHGWQNTGADPATVERVRNQIKDEAKKAPAAPAEPPATANHENPPAPTPGEERKEKENMPPPAANAPVTVSAPTPGKGGPHPALTDDEKKARRDAALKDRDNRSNGAAAGPSTPAAAADNAALANPSPARKSNKPHQSAPETTNSPAAETTETPEAHHPKQKSDHPDSQVIAAPSATEGESHHKQHQTPPSGDAASDATPNNHESHQKAHQPGSPSPAGENHPANSEAHHSSPTSQAEQGQGPKGTPGDHKNKQPGENPNQ